MLTIYINDLNFAHLAKLQNLLDKAVTLCPLNDRLIALKCEGKTVAYLAKLSVPPGEISQIEWETLTPKEQSVLELLRHRLTNRQIGEQLEITDKTVEKHVSNILRKLGLNSRLDILQDQDL